MTTAGGVRMAQLLIVLRSAGISMFVGAALFLLVKVTLDVCMWFPIVGHAFAYSILMEWAKDGILILLYSYH